MLDLQRPFDLGTFRLDHGVEYNRQSPCFGCASVLGNPYGSIPAIERTAPIKQLTDSMGRTFYATSQVVTPYIRNNNTFTNSHHPLLSATSGICAYLYNYLDGNGNLSDANNLDLMPHVKCNLRWESTYTGYNIEITNADVVNCFMHRGDFCDYDSRAYGYLLTFFPLIIPTTKIKTQFYDELDDCIHVGYGGTFDGSIESQWPISGTSWPYIYFNNLTKFKGNDNNIWGCSKWALVYVNGCIPDGIVNSGCWNYYNSGVPEVSISFSNTYHSGEGFLFHNIRYDNQLYTVPYENDIANHLAPYYMAEVAPHFYFIWQEQRLPTSNPNAVRDATQIITPPIGLRCATGADGITREIDVRFIQFGMEINKQYSLWSGDTN